MVFSFEPRCQGCCGSQKFTLMFVASVNGPLPGPFGFGAGTKSRTRDLLITNQLLYQLSYAGFGGRIIRILACHGKRKYHGSPGLRAGGRISQQDLFLTVAIDDLAGALARRQTDIDEKDRPVPEPWRDIGVKSERLGL